MVSPGTGICQLKLSESWRDSAADTGDTESIAIFPLINWNLTITATFPTHLIERSAFIPILQNLRSIFLRI